jgi:hypothetical protein
LALAVAAFWSDAVPEAKFTAMVAPSTSLAESQHAQSGLLTQVKNCIRFDGLVRIAQRKASSGAV